MQQSSEMQQLINDIKNGVPLSFESVYSLYIPLINSVAEKYSGTSLTGAELEDLRQEAAIFMTQRLRSIQNAASHSDFTQKSV